MKKTILVVTIILLSISTFAGDGAEGGGAIASLWSNTFKENQERLNPKYANTKNNYDTISIYTNDESYDETIGLEVIRFYFDNHRPVEMSEVKMFLVNKNSSKKDLEKIKLKDIIGIVVKDEILLLEDLIWFELEKSNGKQK